MSASRPPLRLFALLLLVITAGAASARTWVDSTGRSTEGDFEAVRGGTVHIRLDDGTLAKVPAKTLSKADQEFVRKRDMLAKADLVALAVRRIDAAVEAGLEEHELDYNEGLNDHMFLRRIFLDLAGRIPNYDEAREFLQSRSDGKRQELVMKLLQSPDYTSHNYNYWAEQLRIRSQFPDTIVRNDVFIHWLKEQIRTNRPYDELVRELITAEGRIWDNPAVGYHLRDSGMKLDHVAFMGKVFLGTDITCAQCHDDPFSHWTQYEYYELSAFLADLETKGPVAKARVPGKKELEAYLAKTHKLDPKVKEQSDKLRNLVGRYQRDLRNLNRASQWAVRSAKDREMQLPDTYEYDDADPGDVVKPRVLFGEEDGAAAAALTPRQRLAAWLTSRDNEHFAMNIANRMWARFMGRGVAEPLYNINPRKAHNPELLQVLAEEMLTLDFDLKAFSWAIVNTKAYNRLATRTKSSEADPYYFPGPVLRRMSAEQVWDSLITLMLGDPMQFQLEPGDEYNALIDLAGQEPESVDAFIERLERFRGFRPADNLVDRDGVPISKAELRPGEAETFGRRLARKESGPSDEQAMQNFMKTAREKKVLLARASELPQPSDPGHFLSKFGQSQRTFVIGASSLDGSVPQVMELMNGYATEILTQPGSQLFLKMRHLRSNFEKADVVFLSILSRPALPNEQHLLDSELREGSGEVYADLIWALLNTPEFLFIK